MITCACAFMVHQENFPYLYAILLTFVNTNGDFIKSR